MLEGVVIVVPLFIMTKPFRGAESAPRKAGLNE
jgi:hypothetical protein